MSELKAYNVVATADVNPDVIDNLGCTEWPAYDKEEADKVIADKDKEIAQLQAMLEERNKQVGELKKACNDKDDWCLHTLKENRHHKYKRCLAMARWCESKVYHIRRTPLCDMSEHEYWQYEDEFWQRWQNRWQEIAEKFKEVK